jgi:hypothetical protein
MRILRHQPLPVKLIAVVRLQNPKTHADHRWPGPGCRKRRPRLREHDQLSKRARARLPRHVSGRGCVGRTGWNPAAPRRPSAAQARLDEWPRRGSGVSARALDAGIHLPDVLGDLSRETSDRAGHSESPGRVRPSGGARFARAEGGRRIRTAVVLESAATRCPPPDRVCGRSSPPRCGSSAGQGMPGLRLALPRPEQQRQSALVRHADVREPRQDAAVLPLAAARVTTSGSCQTLRKH